LRKRFYQAACVAEEPAEGAAGPPAYRVLLDGRPVRTPARRPLAVPYPAVADALAAEWEAQATHIDPRTMPLTRLVNSAIDGVAGREKEVRASIACYAAHDLLCYRAEGPPALSERQASGWQPVLDWATAEFGMPLATTTGLVPVAQDPASLARLEAALARYDAFELAALHELTTLTGSAVLALACIRRRLAPAEAWALAHIDEDFQIEHWGRDAEAEARRTARWAEAEAAGELIGWPAKRQTQSTP
jgi:chaperone required for assembly of F1-ATPase